MLEMILSVSLVLLTAAMLVRDWRFSDKRTKRHHRFTRLLLVACAAIAVLSAISAYHNNKDMERLLSFVDKSPEFMVALNQKNLASEDTVAIACTNGILPIEFAVRNTGDGSIEDLQVHLLMPDWITGVSLGKHWTEGYAPTRIDSNGFARLRHTTQYTFVSPAPIHPGDWQTLGHGRIDTERNVTQIIPMRIKLTASGGAKKQINFDVALLPDEHMDTKTE